MKAFFHKWWGKLKSSPIYVKAGLVAIVFFVLYILLAKKSSGSTTITQGSGTTDNDKVDKYTATPTTSTSNSSMATEQNYLSRINALQNELTSLQNTNSQLVNSVNSAYSKASTKPNNPYSLGNQVNTALTPVIVKSATGWLSSILNPNVTSGNNKTDYGGGSTELFNNTTTSDTSTGFSGVIFDDINNTTDYSNDVTITPIWEGGGDNGE